MSGDNDFEQESAGKKPSSSNKASSLANAWAIVGAGVLVLAIAIYIALPLFFGTREHGTVGDCTEHVSYGHTRTTSYRCHVQLTNGTATTVSFDSSKSYGERATLTMWRGETVDTRDATFLASCVGGGGLLVLAVGAWFVRWTVTHRRSVTKASPA